MANKITTTGTTNDPLETQWQASWGRGEWANAHATAVLSATPSGDTLTTTWPVDSGPDHTVQTERRPDEDDEKFKERHVTDFLSAMIVNPPDPN